MTYLLIIVGNLVGRSREMAVRKCYGAESKNIHALSLIHICEIIVQFYSHILHLLQREMILSHLIHVRLEFFCLIDGYKRQPESW